MKPLATLQKKLKELMRQPEFLTRVTKILVILEANVASWPSLISVGFQGLGEQGKKEFFQFFLA
jgi:hypothetical protein